MLIIFAGPSAVGKDRLADATEKHWGAQRVVPVTTRSRRTNEVAGIDYEFVSQDSFHAEILSGRMTYWDFLFGYYYGYRDTLRRSCAAQSESGIVVIHCLARMALRIRKEVSETVLIFLSPGNMGLLDRRLREREISDEEYSARQAYRREEMAHSLMFDIVIDGAEVRDAADIMLEIRESLKFRE